MTDRRAGKPGSTVRMRGHALMERNRRLSQHEPLCRWCQSGRCEHGKPCYQAGTQTDHIVPLHKGGPDKESNLQRLCDDCHAVKTRQDLGHKPRPRIGLDGWPVETDEKG